MLTLIEAVEFLLSNGWPRRGVKAIILRRDNGQYAIVLYEDNCAEVFCVYEDAEERIKALMADKDMLILEEDPALAFSLHLGGELRKRSSQVE